MIMMGRKKEVLSQILGPDDSEAKSEGGGEATALHSCVQELIEAISNKDVEGAVGALRACIAEINSGD